MEMGEDNDNIKWRWERTNRMGLLRNMKYTFTEKRMDRGRNHDGKDKTQGVRKIEIAYR